MSKNVSKKRKRIELFLCTIMYKSQDLFSRFCIQFCLCSFVLDKEGICLKKFVQTKLFHCLFGVCGMRFPSMMEHYCLKSRFVFFNSRSNARSNASHVKYIISLLLQVCLSVIFILSHVCSIDGAKKASH